MKPTYQFPEFNPPQKPKEITGPLSQAWDYLVNRKGVCRVEQFDEDHEPVGPSLREQLAKHGVKTETSGKTTIIYFHPTLS